MATLPMFFFGTGVAGGVLAGAVHYLYSINFPTQDSITLLAVVLMGGAYSLWGAIIAALLGTTLASTDPATLVPIFRQVRIRDRVAQTVMSESAFNDAMGAIVTFMNRKATNFEK